MKALYLEYVNKNERNYHFKKPHRLYENLNFRHEAPEKKKRRPPKSRPRFCGGRPAAPLLWDLHKTSDGLWAACCTSTVGPPQYLGRLLGGLLHLYCAVPAAPLLADLHNTSDGC